MTDAPNNQEGTDKDERQTKNDVLPIIAPQALTIPQTQPPESNNQNAKKKSRWCSPPKDPAMFWITAAAFIAVCIYTAVTKYQLDEMIIQSKLSRDQIALANPPKVQLSGLYIYTKGGSEQIPPEMISDEEIEAKIWINDGGPSPINIHAGDAIIYLSPSGVLPMYRPWENVPASKWAKIVIPDDNWNPINTNTLPTLGPPYGLSINVSPTITKSAQIGSTSSAFCNTTPMALLGVSALLAGTIPANRFSCP